jgi:hypothetical protein
LGVVNAVESVVWAPFSRGLVHTGNVENVREDPNISRFPSQLRFRFVTVKHLPRHKPFQDVVVSGFVVFGCNAHEAMKVWKVNPKAETLPSRDFQAMK